MRRFSILMLLTSLLGCAQILDIEERKSTGEPGAAAGCEEYCAEATRVCTAEASAQLFETTEQCLAVCATYPTGSATTSNTLACRVAALEDAAGAGEARNTCAPASSGGGPADPESTEKSPCGTNCEGYCSLYAATCQEIPDCIERCGALLDVGLRNAPANFSSNEDSLQCRLAHVATAAFYKQQGRDEDRKSHCGHSGIKTAQQCDGAFSCKSYCQLVMNACTGATAVYVSADQCEQVCAKIPNGMVKEIEANNLRCRREYGYKALEEDPARFCTHAGPVTGLCGDISGNRKCESYCSLLEAGCTSQFAIKWGAGNEGQAKCRANCTSSGLNGIGQNGTFSINNTSENDRANTLNCRASRLLGVFSGDKRPETCLAAFGGGACGSETIP